LFFTLKNVSIPQNQINLSPKFKEIIMIFDVHYLIFVYFLPFIIFFGVLFILLSRIFPNQKRVSAIIAIAMSALGLIYIINTGFAQSFFLNFVGKTVEIIGLGGVLIFFISLLGIKISNAIGNSVVRMAILMIFSLIMIFIFKNTSVDQIASPIFFIVFLLGFFGFGYFASKKMK